MIRSMIHQYIEEVTPSGFNFIDFGSSGTLDSKWCSIKDLINLIGFDPNVEECKRQNELPSEYRSSLFLPYAVHGEDGKEILYKTRNKYCYSLLKPNKVWLDRFSFHNLFDVLEEESIFVKGIGCIDEVIDFGPDIIKIDVQGVELPILRKSKLLLDSVFYVETESGFTENYINETTFSQLDEFMRSNGFLMFDLNINHRISRNNIFQKTPTGKEQILWAEAVWLKDYVALEEKGKLSCDSLSKLKVKKVLILCAVQGCYDFGFELAEFFCKKGFLSKNELEGLLKLESWQIREMNKNNVIVNNEERKTLWYLISEYFKKVKEKL